MAIDFSAFPPEINSGLLYSGPGAVPMMAAATAYANLAAEVSATATQWESIISTLTTEQWTGGGSAAAATAAQPIVTYLTDTATALEQAATQATASAAAYETAFAATVPPPVVAVNRATQAALLPLAVIPTVAAEIAALDAQYAEMWAQDALAMTAYQAGATAASALTPVTPLTTTTDPGVQGLATADALAAPAAQPLAAAVSAALPFQSTGLLQSIDGFLGTPSVLNGINGAVNTGAWFVTNGITTAVSLGHTLAGAAVPAAAVSDVVPEAGSAGVMEGTVVRSVTPIAGLGYGGAATGSLGQATTVGKLSVPATWSAATPVQAELAAATAPLEGSGWTVATEETGTVMGAPGMPGMVGAAKGAGAFGSGPRYGFKPIVMPKQVVV